MNVSADIGGNASAVFGVNAMLSPGVNIHNNTYHVLTGTFVIWWNHNVYRSIAAWTAATGKGQGDILG